MLKLLSLLWTANPLAFAVASLVASWHHQYAWAWSLILTPIIIGAVQIAGMLTSVLRTADEPRPAPAATFGHQFLNVANCVTVVLGLGMAILSSIPRLVQVLFFA